MTQKCLSRSFITEHAAGRFHRLCFMVWRNGITIPAGFSVTRLSLVTRGFIYAIAHVRGGKRWGIIGLQGRGAKKPNS